MTLVNKLENQKEASSEKFILTFHQQQAGAMKRCIHERLFVDVKPTVY